MSGVTELSDPGGKIYRRDENGMQSQVLQGLAAKAKRAQFYVQWEPHWKEGSDMIT